MNRKNPRTKYEPDTVKIVPEKEPVHGHFPIEIKTRHALLGAD